MNYGLGRFVQQEGRGAYTGPATQAEWDAFDSFVAAEVAALRSMGYSASAVEYHPTVEGGTGPHHAGDSPLSGEGAYYHWLITVDPSKFPGYVRLETVARYADYAGGDPVKSAEATVRDATAMSQAGPYVPPEPLPIFNDTNSFVDAQGVRRPIEYKTSVQSSVLQSAVENLGVSPTWFEQNKWLVLAGAGVAIYLFMGRGK
jgi:hypothetical protein